MLHIIEMRQAAITDSLLNHVYNYLNDNYPRQPLFDFANVNVSKADQYNYPYFIGSALTADWQLTGSDALQITALPDDVNPIRAHLVTDGINNKLLILMAYARDEPNTVSEMYVGYNSDLLYHSELFSKLKLRTSDWRFTQV